MVTNPWERGTEITFILLSWNGIYKSITVASTIFIKTHNEAQYKSYLPIPVVSNIFALSFVIDLEKREKKRMLSGPQLCT